MRIKLVQIVSAAAIPVLAATSLPTWVAGGLGALIVVLESIQQLFQFHSNWTHYRSTSEALKHEKFLYLAHAGSYATAANPEALLAERIEGRVSQEHASWASEQSQGQAPEVAMAQRIFISYRRDDSRGYAGRLQGDLSRRYSDEHVFRDVEIPPGADFGEYITGLVDKCNVVLAIIGPGWLDARDREGERRIDKPDDWVRLEIERALARDGVEVIPVLVDGARLPPREELPESLLALRRRNAFELSDRRWDYDVDQLGQHLDRVLRGTSALHVRPAGPADDDGAAAARPPPAPSDPAPRPSRPTTPPSPSSPPPPSRCSPPSPPTSSPTTWSTARRWTATAWSRSATSSSRRRSSSASPGRSRPSRSASSRGARASRSSRSCSAWAQGSWPARSTPAPTRASPSPRPRAPTRPAPPSG